MAKGNKKHKSQRQKFQHPTSSTNQKPQNQASSTNQHSQNPTSPPPTQMTAKTPNQPKHPGSFKVQPEQKSLEAHDQVKKYLADNQLKHFSKEDLNAVLRLSQHLRVFGLLSAVGYINQTNAQEGVIRQRTVPVWHSLLGQLICPHQNPLPNKADLMAEVVRMTRNDPSKYMATWQSAIAASNHWNFWARAYSQE
jgi:hypothetical protein